MDPRIAVIGCGYLGVTHAACLADLGYDVLGVDTDAAKVARLTRGEPTFYEPGLAALLGRHTASGRLRFTTSHADAAEYADVHFLCLGTPQRDDGLAADTGQLTAAVDALAPHLTRSVTLVGKATVPPGTAHTLSERAAGLAGPGVEIDIAWNPEFLREGHAVEDTLRPDRIVLGADSAEAEKVMREVYAPLLDTGVPLVVTDVATAELTKLSANAFLAMKVSFINAVAQMCDAAGADVVTLAEALGRDSRIGRSFLAAGLGYGGGCLPKDVRSMTASADELGARDAAALLREVDRINAHCRTRLVDIVVEQCGGSVNGRCIGVLGAAFKPGTDDVRDSPALEVSGQLRARGARVRVYDPQANANAAALFPSLDYVESVVEAVHDADLVLHLTEWPEFRDLDPGDLAALPREAQIVDGRNALDPHRWRAAGWVYRGVGR